MWWYGNLETIEFVEAFERARLKIPVENKWDGYYGFGNGREHLKPDGVK